MNVPSNKNILQLQQQLAENSQLALKELYNIFSERLLHLAFTIIHNKELAEEIVADVFIQLWQKRERIESVENLTFYLYVATKNISINYLRKKQRDAHFDLDTIVLPYYVVETDALKKLASAELMQQVNKAINNLPPKCRLVFKLVKEDGLSYKEVASLLDISVKTVENQMGIALKRLYTSMQLLLPEFNIKQKQ